MDQILNFDGNSSPASLQERRKHPREARSIRANYMVKGTWYKGSVLNLSEGGAFIGTYQGKMFTPGEAIFLVARIRFLREQLRGKIAWVGPHGMGVKFQSAGWV